MERKPLVLAPGAGRRYEMGRLSAVFKADGHETADGYSISEWWLEPHCKGPGAHQHAEDDVFYVLAGTVYILIDQQWHAASAGSFVLIPARVQHDFENRSDTRAGLLNLSFPGGFEPHMPAIANWFRARPPGEA